MEQYEGLVQEVDFEGTLVIRNIVAYVNPVEVDDEAYAEDVVDMA